jgi:glucans biosynthesis protein C
MERRHDIDALRAIAFAILILYHIGMLYVHDWGWHLKSSYQSEWLQIPMFTVNRWRMDLIFLISGISTAFIMSRLSVRQFAKARCVQLLLPFLFGVLVIVPVQPYCQGVAKGLVEPGFWSFLARYYTGYAWPAKAFDGWEYGFTWNHLWYLAYLIVYTVLLVALQKPLQSRLGVALQTKFVGLRGTALLTLPALPLLLYTATLQPHFPHKNNLIEDWYAHAMYFTMFIYGWWLGRNPDIWNALAAVRVRALALTVIFYAIYMTNRALASDDSPWLVFFAAWALRNLYIWAALCAILGWAHALLNRPFAWLPWAREAVYPWYILHQSLIVLIAYWVVPLKIGAFLEVSVVTIGTLFGCWFLTRALIRRQSMLRVFFGLRRRSET